MGCLLFEEGSFDECLPHFQLAQRNANVRLDAILYLGRSYSRKKFFDLAIEQFNTFKSEIQIMDDRKKEAVYELGCCFEEMGQTEKAIEEFKLIYSADISFRMLPIKSTTITLTHDSLRMAERAGFEPAVPCAHPISSRAHSTTLPPLQIESLLKFHSFWQTFYIQTPLSPFISTLARFSVIILITYMIRKHSRNIFLLITVLTLLGCKSSHQATVDFADGSYTGSLGKDGKKNGKGIYRWLNGSIYEGEYKNDMRHGKRPFHVGKW